MRHDRVQRRNESAAVKQTRNARERSQCFRIQYLLCGGINQQAIFSEKIDTQNRF